MLTIAGGILIAVAVIFFGGLAFRIVFGIFEQRSVSKLAASNRLRLEREREQASIAYDKREEATAEHNKKIAEDREYVGRYMSSLKT